jgi:hypothetical protein
MVKVFRYCGLVITLLLLTAVVGAPGYAATIEASIDRMTVQENESVNLTFSSDADVDDDPDFSPLEKDFRILNRSQSSNISIINGRVSRQMTWQLMLMPKRSGDLTIPSIAFGRDQSNVLSLNVSPAKAGGSSGIADDLVYIEASVDNDMVYVQSQLVYTLRIYHAVQLRNASLSELEVSDGDAIIEKLSENRTYEKFINGRRYRVFEKQFAIFPQNVGEFVIEPAVLEAQYIDLPRVLRTKRVVSDPVKITVQEIPQQARQAQSGYWLPARSLTLTEQWSDGVKEIKVGEPITRTLTLTASGLLSSQLPELSNIASKTGMKQYADQPVLDNAIKNDGYVGKRQEKIAYIPTEPGELKLPAIKIVWWNTQTNKLETAKLPGRVIKVAGVAEQDGQVPVQAETGIRDAAGLEHTGNGDQPQQANDKFAGISSQVWVAISAALFILWSLTLISWFIASHKRGRRNAVIPSDHQDTVSAKAVLKQVKSACDSHDPQQVKLALIDWARVRWPDQPPTSVGHIAQRVNGALAAELRQLNDVLYKPGGAPWNSDGLWNSLKIYVEKYSGQPKQRESVIQPMYRLATVNKEK